MEIAVIILAFFFGLLLCLGLILVKWVITQLGATLFFLILFLVAAMFLLAMGDREHDE
jgi:hypothetical protein